MDYLHIDVMDGHFVPNLTLGPVVVAAINRSTDMFLDVHLMMYNPFDYIERFVEAGADRLTIHFEATEEVDETLAYIRKCNVKAGLAFCPETSMSMVPRYLDKCDMVLLMTVHPGFGGQAFMPEVLEKIQFVAKLRHHWHPRWRRDPIVQRQGVCEVDSSSLRYRGGWGDQCRDGSPMCRSRSEYSCDRELPLWSSGYVTGCSRVTSISEALWQRQVIISPPG